MAATSILRRLGRALTGLVLCVFILGCGPGNLTKANYDKIKNGMTLDEVEKILGRGDQQATGDGSNIAAGVGVDLGGASGGGRPGSSDKVFLWESGGRKITITFTPDNKVKSKTSSGM